MGSGVSRGPGQKYVHDPEYKFKTTTNSIFFLGTYSPPEDDENKEQYIKFKERKENHDTGFFFKLQKKTKKDKEKGYQYEIVYNEEQTFVVRDKVYIYSFPQNKRKLIDIVNVDKLFTTITSTDNFITATDNFAQAKGTFATGSQMYF